MTTDKRKTDIFFVQLIKTEKLRIKFTDKKKTYAQTRWVHRLPGHPVYPGHIVHPMHPLHPLYPVHSVHAVYPGHPSAPSTLVDPAHSPSFACRRKIDGRCPYTIVLLLVKPSEKKLTEHIMRPIPLTSSQISPEL